MSTLDIVGLCGSLRAASLNRMALKLAGASMPPSMKLDVVDWRDVPVFDGDVLARGLPAPLAALRERALAALDELRAAPERFAQRAAELSNCPSAQVGGNLGQLARESVVPEFWQALMASDGTGVLPALVETRYGLHIVRVARRVAGRALPFEAVQPQIMQRLSELGLKRALREYAHALVHGDAEHAH